MQHPRETGEAAAAASPVRVAMQPMEDQDIDEVMIIEQASFPTSWPSNAFWNEIHRNKLAQYFVARAPVLKDGTVSMKLVGYAGMWIVLDEAHITTIAVHPQFKGRKIGEQLLLELFSRGIEKGTKWATLEVRESNRAAQALYKKYGFSQVGLRKNYYLEEKENAVVMWAGNLRGELFKAKLARLKNSLEEALTGAPPYIDDPA